MLNQSCAFRILERKKFYKEFTSVHLAHMFAMTFSWKFFKGIHNTIPYELKDFHIYKSISELFHNLKRKKRNNFYRDGVYTQSYKDED